MICTAPNHVYYHPEGLLGHEGTVCIEFDTEQAADAFRVAANVTAEHEMLVCDGEYMLNEIAPELGSLPRFVIYSFARFCYEVQQ